LKSKLIQLGLIPEEIFLIKVDAKSKSLPIYTGVYQKGRNNVILEAFFSNEKHLLNIQGDILHESKNELQLGELDGKEILRKSNGDIYQDSTYIFIDQQYLGDSHIDFQSDVNIDYLLWGGFSDYEKVFKGNGKNMIFENLPLGKYYINSVSGTILKKSIGLFLEDAGEIKINSFSFPHSSQKYKYDNKYDILLTQIEKVKYKYDILLTQIEKADFLIEIIKKYPNCFNSLTEEVKINIEEKMENLLIKQSEAEKLFVPFGKDLKKLLENLDYDDDDKEEDDLPF
jgi:hypothetical protein